MSYLPPPAYVTPPFGKNRVSDPYVYSILLPPSGLHLNQWKNFIPDVVNAINLKKPVLPKSRLMTMIQFFTRKNVHIPELDRFFKFKVNEEVIMDLGTQERKSFLYKWSLFPGNKKPLSARLYVRIQSL